MLPLYSDWLYSAVTMYIPCTECTTGLLLILLFITHANDNTNHVTDSEIRQDLTAVGCTKG